MVRGPRLAQCPVEAAGLLPSGIGCQRGDRQDLTTTSTAGDGTKPFGTGEARQGLRSGVGNHPQPTEDEADPTRQECLSNQVSEHANRPIGGIAGQTHTPFGRPGGQFPAAKFRASANATSRPDRPPGARFRPATQIPVCAGSPVMGRLRAGCGQSPDTDSAAHAAWQGPTSPRPCA